MRVRLACRLLTENTRTNLQHTLIDKQCQMEGYQTTRFQMAAGRDQVLEEQPVPDDEAGNGEIVDIAGGIDEGSPDHMGAVKQLHNENGYNLAVSSRGHVYGTPDRFHMDAVLEFHSSMPGEVQLQGRNSGFYIAMDNKGKVYGERDPNMDCTLWLERTDEPFNYYIWKEGYPEKEYLLGIKKSGKTKRGDKTRPGQKAVRFLPRSAYPRTY